MKDILLKKLSQESSWRGILTLLGGVGVVIQPDLQEYILGTVLGIVGIINWSKKD